MIKQSISRLKAIIPDAARNIKNIPEEVMSAKPLPGKWSKKEVLGHLIDSAANNHSRFVRAQFEEHPFAVQKYAQDSWVSTQEYNTMSAEDIINMWQAYNSHIIRVIERIPHEKLSIPVDIGASGEVTLEWLIQDYVDHIEHHLKQVI
jgi:hypothetical protein